MKKIPVLTPPKDLNIWGEHQDHPDITVALKVLNEATTCLLLLHESKRTDCLAGVRTHLPKGWCLEIIESHEDQDL